MGGNKQQQHLLRIVLTCRKLTAQVTNPNSDSIVAMASTQTKLDPYQHYTTRRSQFHWDAKVASRIGHELGCRLKQIGVSDVCIDVGEEMSRPIHHRKLVIPLFQSVQSAGIEVAGAQDIITAF